jgi:hypothetical protein
MCSVFQQEPRGAFRRVINGSQASDGKKKCPEKEKFLLLLPHNSPLLSSFAILPVRFRAKRKEKNAKNEPSRPLNQTVKIATMTRSKSLFQQKCHIQTVTLNQLQIF